VIGGGDVGAVAVRQILRACAAGRLQTERVVVIDRRQDCEAQAFVRAASGSAPEVRLEVAEWSPWLDAHLGAASERDHLVPYHWAPHLLVEWLVAQVRRAGGTAFREGLVPARGLPFEAVTSSGDRALSYADWMCPPLCVEPEICPHTERPRDWTLAGELGRRGQPGSGDLEPIVFPCLHLTDGVGTVPVALIQAAARHLVSGLAEGERSYLVATASHCHGLAARLRVASARAAACPSHPRRVGA
jgi:hypothetical protein